MKCFRLYLFVAWLAISFMIALHLNAQNTSTAKGTCTEPFEINDSIFNIKVNNTSTTWFFFKAKKQEQFITITDEKNNLLNYLVFLYTGNEFCTQIKNKNLIPERNKVCDKTIDFDASNGLSYENINRGVCNCSYCCTSFIKFLTVPGLTYYIVIYNHPQSIKIEMLSKHNESATSVKKTIVKENTFSANLNINDIEVGQSITLENIYFEGGLPTFLRTSYTALDALYDFLKNNPSVKIEIHGHVNGPNQAPDINYSNNLGYRRAKAVFDYLVNKGVNKTRMTYKGFGNTQMIYPNAIIEEQMARNRRVEIIILSK